MPGIGRQSCRVPMSNGAFLAEIADSAPLGSCMKSKRCRRLVCARRLSRQCGGSVDGEVLNEGGLRHYDEFVRHKILDCLGDLYLPVLPCWDRLRRARSEQCSQHALLKDEPLGLGIRSKKMKRSKMPLIGPSNPQWHLPKIG